MNGTLTFLGTGTSMGVPTIGCSCAVCTSANPRDRRLRPSVLIRWNENPPEPGLTPRERAVVIDTGPDFREQALRTGLKQVDAVLYTHGHADHILGLDDLRPLSFIAQHAGGPIPLHAAPDTASILERIYDYTFSPSATYPTRARVEIRPLADITTVHGVEFLRIPVLHGDMEVAGFRFGNAAYLTDVSEIPESSFALLEGVETLVLPALRHHPHPSHATVAQAVGWAGRIGARQTWLTHIAHELGHDETNRMLPENVRMAWDGLEIPIALPGKSEAA
jgi:phosphoribosyl 1,2-cyclic phosphate phosphodiesterase